MKKFQIDNTEVILDGDKVYLNPNSFPTNKIPILVSLLEAMETEFPAIINQRGKTYKFEKIDIVKEGDLYFNERLPQTPINTYLVKNGGFKAIYSEVTDSE